MSEEQKELSVACQSLGDWTRTHTCGELTGADNGAEVCLMGILAKVKGTGVTTAA